MEFAYMGTRSFHTESRGQIEASEIRLYEKPQIPGTFGWLHRFELVTIGEAAERWGNISAYYVAGILDPDGNWQADFPEPTAGNPTKF